MFTKLVWIPMSILCALTMLSGCSNDTVRGPESLSKNEQSAQTMQSNSKPNIVLILTDDQGYGDVGYNDNPIIDTPNINQLAQQSISFNDFHVDPTCSPTRASLLTGKHSLHAGVWHTILARYMLGPEHDTLAEVLGDNGYKTGIFGKWHLGDNYPYRPQDQGFDEVVIHGGGGVGQTPDYWGNTQFDDTYYHNGDPKYYPGYATKVWFDLAKDFISEHKEQQKQANTNSPYFAYIPLNAPHGPYRAPEEYITPYLEQGLSRAHASFYAMITYIDEQVGGMKQFLRSQGDLDNTIFIFMTDNGTSLRITKADTSPNDDYKDLAERYPQWQLNGGLRGHKVEVYEGGHKVPFLMHYPNGNFTVDSVEHLTAHFDVMPTLLDLVGIDYDIKDGSGLSVAPLLIADMHADSSAPSEALATKSEALATKKALEERSIIVTNQRVDQPSIERPTVVAYKDWRYIRQYGKEALYNLALDPKQQENVISEHPVILKELKSRKQAWWARSQSIGFKDRYIGVGFPQENPARLNAMDWMEVPEGQKVPWFIGHQPPAPEWDYIHWLTKEHEYQPLPWYIDVASDGQYEVSAYYHDIPAGTPVQKKHCVIDANGKQHVVKIHGRASHCKTTIALAAGKQKISAWFSDNAGTKSKDKASFYLYIKKL